ncbi:hypothetical protein HMPREF9999_01135 [Alloprevotella sp. oral taxon 473 str. F0040]|nr:hypothetical protein HMPREF9999_01135 [Alloprevotella sp. oral taxon 473 str. F0040]
MKNKNESSECRIKNSEKIEKTWEIILIISHVFVYISQFLGIILLDFSCLSLRIGISLEIGSTGKPSPR